MSRKRKANCTTVSEPPPKIKEEKRACKYRYVPSMGVSDRIKRAIVQKMYLISQKDISSDESIGREYVVLGSTGNVYNVAIKKVPNCNCPDFERGNLCKHVLFVFLKVLKVPPESPLIYQRALLQKELQSIFSSSPMIARDVLAKDEVICAYEKTVSGNPIEVIEIKDDDDDDNERSKPSGDCAICCDNMEDSKEVLTQCKQCKNFVHDDCLKRWFQAATSKSCVYCRSDWNFNDAMEDNTSGTEGFLNLGKIQGMSASRQYTGRGHYSNYRWRY
jgi:hypothetical protein